MKPAPYASHFSATPHGRNLNNNVRPNLRKTSRRPHQSAGNDKGRSSHDVRSSDPLVPRRIGFFSARRWLPAGSKEPFSRSCQELLGEAALLVLGHGLHHHGPRCTLAIAHGWRHDSHARRAIAHTASGRRAARLRRAHGRRAHSHRTTQLRQRVKSSLLAGVGEKASHYLKR
jgi:hypothetical protein